MDGQSHAAAESGQVSAGSTMVVPFTGGTAGMMARFWLKPALNAANPNHFVGRYKALLRCRVGDPNNTVVAVRLRWAWGQAADEADAGEIVYASQGGGGFNVYRLLDLGNLSIPGGSFKDTMTALELDHFQIIVEAERLQGAGELRCDRITLIPAEHFLFLEETHQYHADNIGVYTLPDWSVEAYMTGSGGGSGPGGGVLARPRISHSNWSAPRDMGVMVYEVERQSKHLLDDNEAPMVQVHRRFAPYGD
jgi:hypothetical protein